MEYVKFSLPTFQYTNLKYKDVDLLNYVGNNKTIISCNDKALEAGYLKQNTVNKQTFNVNKDIEDFASSIFHEYTVSVIEQPPGNTNPEHIDTFHTLASKYNFDADECIRINIFLENWISGHYFEINNSPITKWKRGDAIVIKKDEPHLSGNMGSQNKYTMQITGHSGRLKQKLNKINF